MLKVFLFQLGIWLMNCLCSLSPHGSMLLNIGGTHWLELVEVHILERAVLGPGWESIGALYLVCLLVLHVPNWS